ncbi:Mobile element protein (plasmid) [Sinorhizobium sp. CCBAU 05631]|nr:Mobile element protein [Sinorhizobium sp. CCBAU 05631]ASY74223.1 Mobile element protein [Sinorhizobium fredii CCBAU 83666]
MTTKIHMLADALGRPLRLIITAGQVGDVTQAEALLEGRSGTAVLADKAYDSNALRETIAAMKAAYFRRS